MKEAYIENYRRALLVHIRDIEKTIKKADFNIEDINSDTTKQLYDNAKSIQELIDHIKELVN